MLDTDFIQEVEQNLVSHEEAMRECVHAYKTAWTQIGLISEVLTAIGEDATVSMLNEANDLLQRAMDDHFSIDMDGNMHMRT